MSMLELNTNAIRLNGLQWQDSVGALDYDNVATVDVTLQIDDVDVTGETWPLNVPYIASTDGIYYVAFSDDIGIDEGDRVTVTVNSLSVNGKGNWEEDVHVYTRRLDGNA